MATNYIAPTWRMPENTNKDKLSNYSLDLDGTSEYVEFSGTNFLNNGQASFSFWIKPKNWPGGSNYGYFLSGSSPGGLAYSEGSSAGSYYPGVLYWYTGSSSYILDVTLSENVWSHIVIVFDGTSIKTYKDGVLGTTTTIVQPSALSFNTIGRYRLNNVHYINGFLSEFSIFNYAVTQEQVNYLYNLNNPMAITGTKPVAYWSFGDNSNPIRLQGYPNLAVGGSGITPHSNYSIKFNGSSQYFGDGTTSGIFNGATSLSISQWINIDPGETTFIGAANWQGAGKYQYLTRYRSQSGGFDFYVRISGASRYGRFTTSITGGAWYHVVGTWDGSNVRIYLNGVPGTPMSTTGTLDASTGENLLGLYQSTRADGLMSNVAYWYNKTLTQQEVSEIYNNGITTDLNNFSGGAPTRWYPMDGKSTYFNGSTLVARDVINNVDMLGYNNVQTSIEGNAPGSSANGTGNNLDISNLKGNMINSTKNSYSINMADYGDPNNQGLTPANSGRTTEVPG